MGLETLTQQHVFIGVDCAEVLDGVERRSCLSGHAREHTPSERRGPRAKIVLARADVMRAAVMPLPASPAACSIPVTVQSRTQPTMPISSMLNVSNVGWVKHPRSRDSRPASELGT